MRLPGISGRKHPRLVGLTSVVMVAAAATGGYVGLTSGSTRPLSTVGRSAPPRLAGASSADAPTPGPDDGAMASGGGGDMACPMIPATTGPAGPSGQSAGIGAATHLFTRTTADGVTIRTYRLPDTGFCGCGPIPAVSSSPPSSGSASSGSAPSGSASSVDVTTEGAVSVELSDDSAVGVGTLFDFSNPTATTADAGTGPADPVSGVFGVAEGAPVWWTALSVGPDVAGVQMTFADGSTDQMAPVDGVVVLAHTIDSGVAATGPGPDVVRGTLRLRDAAGALLSTVTVPEATTGPATPPLAVPGSPPVTSPGPVNRSSATGSSGPTTSAAAGANGVAAICAETVGPARSPDTVVSPSMAS